MIGKLGTLLMLLLVSASLFAQTGDISGRLTDNEKKEPLVGATVTLVGTRMGAVTDASGSYTMSNVPNGAYTIRFAYVGYITAQRRVVVSSSPATVDAALEPTTIQTSEVVIEVNRAKERETPVAFTNVDKLAIEQKIHGQDAPLLVQGTPGVYTYSTDGVGNGEAKVMVRGFSQNYVQVLINGVPTNDPESNSVYWSNWGSVSSNAQSIQIQRGAGSSLYGAGSFGGSFNIVTADAPAKSFYGLNLSAGDPFNSMVGVDLKTGLIGEKFSAAFRFDRKVAEGSRTSGRYEGYNYYGSLSWFINPQQSLKFVLHGAPQKHGYSYSNDVSYFKKYGYKANSAYILPLSVVDALPVDANTGRPSYGLLDDSRELTDPNYVNLSHNFYHKTQAELHYRFDISPVSAIQATAFYSKGRGGGSSITLASAGTLYSRGSDGTVTDLYGPGGVVTDVGVARDVFLKNAIQRISYSFHQQGGILANFTTRPVDFATVTLGGEFRSWTADHPGHFVNLYGKTSYTYSYARKDTLAKVMSSTFTRKIYQGDLDGPTSDIGNIFGWTMAGANDAAYATQYRNYRGETPQYTVFGQVNWQFNKLNIITSLQYVWYKYKLLEYMPSENGIGTMLTRAQEAARGSALAEGPTGNGTFLMKDNATSNPRWYEFTLVNETRSRGFLQPKFGLNFNATENLNMFANFAHVERFIDLGVYYNQGRVNPDVGDEKSDQYEVGVGWTSPEAWAKVNGYLMTWDNKSASIRDLSKAGEPGYDRNGFRSELVGKSEHRGIEFEAGLNLNKWLPVKGLELTGSFTYMQNRWKDVLTSVLTDPATGLHRAFNTSGLNAIGGRDTIFFEELANTPVASGPQTMAAIGITYRGEGFFTGLSWNYFARHYALDGGSYMAIDGSYDALVTNGKSKFIAKFDDVLPPYSFLNFNIGTDFDVFGLRSSASIQILNLFDNQFFADADRSGVIPGIGRAFRFNLSTGI